MIGQYVCTSAEMQFLDKLMMEEFGLLPEVLMEQAGQGSARTLSQYLPSEKYRRVLVLCGPGNNGGDGLVCARYLAEMGYEVLIALISDQGKYKGEARRNLLLTQRLNLPMVKLNEKKPLVKVAQRFQPQVVVDALFGTGLKRPISGIFGRTIEELNKLKNDLRLKVLAIDLPSGVCADTGQILGVAVSADVTVTFECLKHGLLNYPGKTKAGKVVVIPIGYTWRYVEQRGLLPRSVFLTLDWVARLYRPRTGYYHKGKAGHLLVLAGSQGKSGAAYLTALGAIKSGAGLVTLASPASLQPVYAGLLPEALTLALPEVAGEPSAEAIKTLLANLSNKKAVVIGPGFGLSEDAFALLRALLQTTNLPMVVDADALTLLAQDLELLNSCKSPRILTPHPGEAERLLKRTISEILYNRKQAALEIAEKTNSVVVLKGPNTIIATPEGNTYYSPFDVPGLAQGGMGDVLSGIIGALLAQGYTPLEAAILGVFLHGLTGENLSKEQGPQGFTASEVAIHLVNTLRCLEVYRDRLSQV